MKLTKNHLQSLIARTEYHRVPETTTTVCSIVLHNGFTVNGQSACINPADFNEQIGRETAYQNAFEKLWELEGYLVKAEIEPLEQTWQGRLLIEYHQLQDRTEKLYRFLAANPEHEAAKILSAQYRPMREYLSVLQHRVAELDERVKDVPPAIEPADKDVIFVKVNDEAVFALEMVYIESLLMGYEDSTVQLTLLFDDEVFPDATGKEKSLAEILTFRKEVWKQKHQECWCGEPMRLLNLDEGE